MIGVMPLDVEFAANDGNLAQQRGDGEGFILRRVVQCGREVWPSLPHTIQKPGMKPDDVLAKELGVVLGVDVKVDSDQFPVSDSHTSAVL